MARFIREMMLEANLYPEDLRPGLSRQTVRGYGQCHCVSCKSSWGSAFTWMTFDLYQQRICRKYQQKCQSCGAVNDMHVRPNDLVLMIDFALYRVISILEGTWKSSGPKTKGDGDGEDGEDGEGDDQLAKKKPHKTELCERCGFGQWDCRDGSAGPQKGGRRKKKSLAKNTDQEKEQKETEEQGGTGEQSTKETEATAEKPTRKEKAKKKRQPRVDKGETTASDKEKEEKTVSKEGEEKAHQENTLLQQEEQPSKQENAAEEITPKATEE